MIIATCTNNTGVTEKLTLGKQYEVAEIRSNGGRSYYVVETDLSDRDTFNADRFEVENERQ